MKIDKSRKLKKTVLFASIFYALSVGGNAALVSSAASPNCTKHGYGQGNAVDSKNCPYGAVDFNAQYGDYGAYALTEDDNQIILTFDQGYENGYTESILDTLKEKDVKAIFFLTGDYAKKETELVQRMIDEGHMVGNHGMTHASMPGLSYDGMVEEIESLHEYVLDKYGYEMQYMRPPCGEYSELSLEAAKETGYKTLFWSFAYVDWNVNCQPNPNEAFTKITDAAHGGEIMLLHSVSSTNAKVLGDVIDNFREQGYKL